MQEEQKTLQWWLVIIAAGAIFFLVLRSNYISESRDSTLPPIGPPSIEDQITLD